VAADAIDHGARRFFIAQLGAESGSFMAGIVQFDHKFLSAVERGIGMHGDPVPARGKLADDRAANADGAASYKSDGMSLNVRHF
jgi:hypothetical protein